MRCRAMAPGVAPGTREGKVSPCPSWSEPPPCPTVLSPQAGEGKPPLSWPEKGLFVAAAFLFHSVSQIQCWLRGPGCGCTPRRRASLHWGHRAWPPRRETPTSSKQRRWDRTVGSPWPPCPLPRAVVMPSSARPHHAQPCSP